MFKLLLMSYRLSGMKENLSFSTGMSMFLAVVRQDVLFIKMHNLFLVLLTLAIDGWSRPPYVLSPSFLISACLPYCSGATWTIVPAVGNLWCPCKVNPSSK